jgi:hypothetical protein
LGSPASRKQAWYKKQSKKQGLMSLEAILNKAQEQGFVNSQDLETLMEQAKEANNPELIQNLFANHKTKLCLNVPVKVDLDAKMDKDGMIVLENKVIYENGKNWHGLDFSDSEMNDIAENFNSEDNESEAKVLNANHSRYPEDAIGEYTNLKVDEQKLIANKILIDANHPSFASQKYVLGKGGVELGFSVELSFEDVMISLVTWDLKFVDPRLKGLATTLIPSAPGTLTDLEVPTETLTKETKTEEAPKESLEVKLSTEEISSEETKEEVIPEPEPKEVPEASTNLEALKLEYETKLQAEVEKLSNNFTQRFDELQKTFNTALNQVNADSEKTLDTVISTLTNQNETLEQQNKSIKRLETLSNPKPVQTF